MFFSADHFEDGFIQAFSTETLNGSCVKLVGLSLRDADDELDQNSCDELVSPLSPRRICQLVRNSENFLAEYLPWVRGVTVSEIAKRMRSWIFAEQYSQGGCWGIFEVNHVENAAESTYSAMEPLVGFIMAEFCLKNRSAQISYWLAESFTGCGFMTDAVNTLCQYCFDSLKLNRLELSIAVTNKKSMAVATRCGFRKEGVSRDFERINGAFVDHVRYSRLARDL